MDRAVLMPGSSGEALELKSYQPLVGDLKLALAVGGLERAKDSSFRPYFKA